MNCIPWLQPGLLYPSARHRLIPEPGLQIDRFRAFGSHQPSVRLTPRPASGDPRIEVAKAATLGGLGKGCALRRSHGAGDLAWNGRREAPRGRGRSGCLSRDPEAEGEVQERPD